MAEITRIGDASGTGTIALIAVLEDVLNELKSGKIEYEKVAVLLLDDSDGDYRTGFYQTGMRISELLALTQYNAHRFSRQLETGYMNE